MRESGLRVGQKKSSLSGFMAVYRQLSEEEKMYLEICEKTKLHHMHKPNDKKMHIPTHLHVCMHTCTRTCMHTAYTLHAHTHTNSTHISVILVHK